jgi:cytoskeletal protein CcmA (bactofilin family)
MSKKLIFSALLLGFFLVMPFKGQAFEGRSSDSVYIPKDQVISGNFYVAGANITVEGNIQGDLICAGQTVNVNAKVDGDIICAAQTINIAGEVGGNVRVAGNTVNINGLVGRNLNVLAATLILGSDAKINWDALLMVGQAEMRGIVSGSLHGAAQDLLVSGQVGKNIDIKLSNYKNKKDQGKLKITDQAKIDGDVVYWANSSADISQNNVSGKVTHNVPKSGDHKLLTAFIINRLYAIFSALLVGLVLVSIWRKTILKLTDKMEGEPASTIGWGAVLLFITPIICFILFMTMIGIPLALILLGLWFLAMFVCKIITAILVGRILFRKLKRKESEKLLLEMTVGVVACWLLFAIPVVGWALSLVAVWWAMGGSWLYFKKAKN